VRNVGIASAFAVLSTYCDCHAQVTIQVLSRPRLTATGQCTSTGAECLIKGKLTDDLDFPLSNQTVHAVLDMGTVPAGTIATLSPCETFAIADSTQPNQGAAVHTNESGEFCFRSETSASQGNANVKINYRGAIGYEPADEQVTLARADASSALKVHESPDRIALESASVAISVELIALGRAAPSQSINLVLEESPYREPQSKKNLISTAPTDASGIAHFTIPGRRFGAPGMAHLVANFEGSRELPPARVVWPILRTCRVNVETRIESKRVAVGDFANVLAVATTECGSLPEGSIEFFLGRNSEVTLPLIHGQTAWQLSTFQFAPGEFSIGSRFVATSAAWSGNEMSWAVLRVLPVSGERRAVWLASGILVLAWFALRWRHSDKIKVSRAPGMPTTARPQSLDVVPSSNPSSGWEGMVIDSHTGTPLAGALVSIEQPGFSETRVLRRAETSQDGTFSLPHTESSLRATLAVVAAKYSRAEWSMPRPGNLVVRLETRRRAIVRSLVAWADKSRQETAAWSEPTPAEIAQEARRQSLAHIDSWANKVETAAFGPDEPSPNDDDLLIPPDATTIGSKQPQ
jgi:hypothetical protein